MELEKVAWWALCLCKTFCSFLKRTFVFSKQYLTPFGLILLGGFDRSAPISSNLTTEPRRVFLWASAKFVRVSQALILIHVLLFLSGFQRRFISLCLTVADSFRTLSKQLSTLYLNRVQNTAHNHTTSCIYSERQTFHFFSEADQGYYQRNEK